MHDPRREAGTETETLELTARNVQALTDKLDDPISVRTLISPCGRISVTAVTGPGEAEAAVAPDTLPLTRAQLQELAAEGAEARVAAVRVVSVPDSAHYGDRMPGTVSMSSRGMYR